MDSRIEPVAGVTAVATAAPARLSLLERPAPTAAALASTRTPNKRLIVAAASPSETESELMQPHSKKRRKQSRPIRIPTPTSEELSTHLNVLKGDNEAAGQQEEEEEAEEGEVTDASSYLLPHQLADICSSMSETNQEHLSERHLALHSSSLAPELSAAYPDSYANNAMQSLLPTLLSFPPHFLLPMLPSSSMPSSQQGSSGPGLPGANNAPPRIFNLEAYCELCSKEFCNKYFLKTHKANRHGIYVKSGDTPPTSTTPLPPMQLPPLQLPASNIEVIDSSPSPSLIITPVKITPTKTPPSELKSSCDICNKKFNSEYSVKRHKAKIHWGGSAEGSLETSGGEEASRPPCSPASIEPESANIEGGDSKSQDTIKNNENDETNEELPQPPPSTSPLSPGRMRRLGVINADAFCEICSKEYCNKYFLKTHKLKRHGIIVRDSDDCKMGEGKLATINMSGAYRVKGWGQGTSMQTSPLNLTLNEQGASNSSDSGGVNIGMMIRSSGVGDDDDEEGLISSSFLVPHKQEPSSPRSEEAAPTSGRDLISEDLQKLQTMLLQLNALNGSSVPCDMFGQQQDNINAQRENLESQQSIEENGGIQGERCDSPRPSSLPSPSTPALEHQQNLQEQPQLEVDGAATCEICGQDIYPGSLLSQHMAEEHGNTTPTPQLQQQLAADDAEAGETNSLGSGNMPFYSTSCYCDICNKELCNKYFKKVHMQKMHGIEIKDNALSGGVPCDICHKQLCSKYFVRVHKQNTHGIVDLSAPTGAPTSGRTGAGSPLGVQAPSLPPPLQQPQDISLKPAEVADLSHRYYTHFNVVCPLCSRRFRSAKWLKAHLVNDHADAGLELARELEPKFSSKPNFKTQQFEENDGQGNNVPPPPPPPPLPTESATAAVLSSLLRSNDERSGGSSYHCSYCNFSTPVLSLLFVHERSHTGLPAGMPAPATRPAYSCHICFKSFGQSELLQRHLRTHQLSGLQDSTVERQDEVEDAGETQQPHAQNRETKDVRGAAAGRYRCAQCHQRFRTRDLWSAHMQSHSKNVEASVGERSTGPPYGCPLCSYTTDVLASFKKHVKHEHWPGTEGAAQSRLWRSLAQVEVSRTLQDAARESHVPATYAVPQAPPEHGDRFIMQPFLLEEPPDSSPAVSSQPPPCSPLEITSLKREESTPRPRSPASSGGDETEQVQHTTSGAVTTSSADGTFVPSLVFLPVREKVSSTLTVSFTLTPA